MVAMTADADDARAYANGQISEATFVDRLSGVVDPTFLLTSSPPDESGSGGF